MSVRKFVYTFQAAYQGKGDMARLKADMEAMKSIDVYSGLQESFTRTSEQFAEAKRQMRNLRREMDTSDDPGLTRQYNKAANTANRLAEKIGSLKGKLDTARTGLKENGVAAADLAGEYNSLLCQFASVHLLLLW